MTKSDTSFPRQDAYKAFKEVPWWKVFEKFEAWNDYKSYMAYENLGKRLVWKACDPGTISPSSFSVDPIDKAIKSYQDRETAQKLSKAEYKKIYMTAWRKRQKAYHTADKDFTEVRKQLRSRQKYLKMVEKRKGEK